MPGPAASIELTATEFNQLTAWERAGTTPQRLARRARLILGSATGLGSRALAQQERLSRTTVRRWLTRFLAKRCDGLHDRPRSGRPTTITPAGRALVVALACELPAERNVPLSRYSLSELSVEVADRLGADNVALSRSSVWRVLINDALRPWRYRYWIFPRDPHFLERAGPVLDLYACQWQGRPLWADEYVLSADEKSQLQALRRRHPDLPPAPGRDRRQEFEYRRGGTLAYLTAYDVHAARVFGRTAPTTGIEPFAEMVEQVMTTEPYASARRVFWIVDNGASHNGARSIARMHATWPTACLVHLPIHASWLNQVEIFFSIVQRKVITPGDFANLHELAERLLAFQDRYNATAEPFDWHFTRASLDRMLERLAIHESLAA
jgi:transposase